MNNAPSFSFRDQQLFCEDTPVAKSIEKWGTPVYVYSKKTIQANLDAYKAGFGAHAHLICYAVKANSNLAILQLLAKAGAGFDIVSGGELARVIAAGADPKKVVFSGVGKTREEVFAALEADILCFNLESVAELDLIADCAKLAQRKARISIRVNPNVDPGTHPYISTGLRDNKFGIAWDDALPTYHKASKNQYLDVVGIDCHIGSQITQIAPFLDAAERVLKFVNQLQSIGVQLHHLDFGGGLGICYRDEVVPEP